MLTNDNYQFQNDPALGHLGINKFGPPQYILNTPASVACKFFSRYHRFKISFLFPNKGFVDEDVESHALKETLICKTSYVVSTGIMIL